MNDAARLFALLVGFGVTWAGFEFYHQMREEAAWTEPWFAFAFLSFLAVLIGGLFTRAAAE